MSARKADKWYRLVFEATERFMVRWHENMGTLSRMRHASVMGGVHGYGEGRGKTRRVGKPSQLTKAESRWQIRTLERYKAD